MRMIAAIAVLGCARLASAEPSYAVGLRTTWNTQLDPPPWIMTGGQWGVRLAEHTWLMFDGDGGRGDVFETHNVLGDAYRRTMISFSLGPSTDVWTHGASGIRVLGGLGVGVEWAFLRSLGDWLDIGHEYRPLAFAGTAFQHHFVYSGLDHGVIGFEVRGVRLFGDGPMADAPALARTSVQGTLELTAYY